jgi:DNA adenine methylase
MSDQSAVRIDDSTSLPKNIKCKPFLKWAGGKSQLISHILKRVPKSFSNYFEPFLGGGAVFFALQPEASFLADTNRDLISAYEVIRDDVELLIRDLERHRYEKKYFYQMRELDRSEGFRELSAVQKVSRLIFLNKTCYNGLYRVNSKGQFNVPFGRYKNPTILDAQNLRACSLALQSSGLFTEDFRSVVAKASKDDFVYFDPPYAPLNDTSDFTAYTKEGFGFEEHIALRDLCRDLDGRGVKFLLSNSSNPAIADLFQEFHVERVDATRAINSKAGKRGKIKELLIRNYSSG